MHYDIYAYGNGEVLRSVFNAVAMCLNSKSGSLYEPLIRLGLIVGAFWGTIYAIYGDMAKLFTSWIIPMTAIMGLLFIPTATINIHDPVTHFRGSVDNVPYGLAAFSGYVSRIGYGITEQVEKVFSLPDDLKYQKTGHIFASSILEKAKQFRITNEDLNENMQQFVGQCVVYDAMLGRKYTIKDLRNTDDIWGLVSTNASPVRSFMWKDIQERGEGNWRAKPITCREGVQKINALWPKEIDFIAGVFGKRIFGTGGQIDAKVEILKSLPLAYSTLGQMSKDASNIIKQQMMIGAVIDGVDKQSTAAGNLPNFAARRAYLQQRSTYQTLGAMAGDTVVIMKAVLEAIAYGSFIFMIPLALLPFGWRFLSSWAQIILWLQMWAPLYAILNFVMTLSAKSKTMAAMSISSSTGVTIANSVGIMDANADISAMAGYLAMSIPFLSIALVRGVGSFVSMASHLGNVSQGAASMAAGEATSGNYSFGNISEGGKQIGNAQMFNQSMAASYRSGSFQFTDGRTDMTTMADGSQIMNVGSSNLPISLNLAESDNAQLSEMANSNYQKSINQSESSAESYADSYRKMVSLSDSLRNSQSMGDGISKGSSVEETKAIQNAAQYLTDFSKSHNLSTSETASAFAEASVGGGVIFKGSAGIKGSVDGLNQEILTDAKKIADTEDFQRATREASQAAQTLSHNTSDEKTKNLAEDVSGSFERGVQLRSEASKSFNEAESYSQQAMMTKANSSSINAKYDQQFVEWLSNQRADGTSGRIGKHGASHIIANNPQETMAYASRFMEERHLVPSSPVHQSANSIKRSYDGEIGHQVHPLTTSHMDAVRNKGKMEGLDEHVIERGVEMRTEVEKISKFNSNKVRVGESIVEHQGAETKDYHNQEQDKIMAQRMAEKVFGKGDGS